MVIAKEDLSDFEATHNVVKGDSAIFDDYLSKPISISDIEKVVNKYIKKD